MIIDFHTHVFPERIADTTVRALEQSGNIESYSDGTVAGLVRSLRSAGVGLGVNLPVLTRPEQYGSVLKFASMLNSSYGDDQPVISFAGVHPDMEDPEEKISEIKRCGFLGIKIHPDYQATFFDDERYVRILRAAKREGLITVTHAGLDAAYVGQPIKCTPERVLRLLDRIGGYDRLVLAHYGANTLFDEVYELLAGEDVYFDTAYILGYIERSDFLRIIEKHGESKILFASDSPWQNIGENVKRLRSFELGAEREDKIFYKNAASLLGMDF